MSKLRRLGLLKFLCKAMQSPQRKILANGLILLIITNNIQLWGFGTKTLLKKVQVMQNKTAKWVLRLPNKSQTKKCYEVLGWMSVRQLLVYHSLMMLFKLIRGSQNYLWPRDCKLTESRTQGDGTFGRLQANTTARRNSWYPRSIVWWNSLTPGLRTELRIGCFKTGLKKWITDNIQF